MRTGLYASLLAAHLGLSGCHQATSVSKSATQPNPQTTASIGESVGTPSGTTTTAAANSTTPSTTNNAGVQAFVNPATGELREPTDAEIAAANRSKTQAQTATSVTSTSVKITQLPNGLTEYDLGSRARVEEIVCIQKDGSLGECSAAELAALRKAAQKKAP